jgi:hypothetical protein
MPATFVIFRIDAGQHANAISQQRAVSRMVDIGLDHGRVYPHASSSGDAFVAGYPHDAFMDLLQHLRPERHAPAAHGLGIRGLHATHMGEVPVHQIGADFALQHLIAPVPDVFENQQSQHHVGRCTPAPARTALRMSFRQCLVYDRNDGFIRQHRIGVVHPVLAKIAHLLGNKAVAKTELRPPHLNRRACLAASRQPVPDAAVRD